MSGFMPLPGGSGAELTAPRGPKPGVWSSHAPGQPRPSRRRRRSVVGATCRPRGAWALASVI